MKTLRLVLGDQLTHTLASLEDASPSEDVILICEVMAEATYVKHHKKKIAFLFSAMRHFAKELEDKGFKVRYVRLDDPQNGGSFRSEVERAVKDVQPDQICLTFPGEYRVLEEMKTWQTDFGIPVEIREDTRFLCSPNAFAKWAAGRKSLRMEFFYREMRKKYDLLMNGPDPVGGAWNYDQDNRKPAEDDLDIPAPYRAQTDEITENVLTLVAEKFDDHFGDLEPFYFAVTRDQALYALDKFIAERLANFGDYQDAMVEGKAWMFHSHLSFYINCGLLLPLEVVKKAEEAYERGDAPLNAVEGFIRQIIGWREYMRGIYWLKMPDYERENFLSAKRDLPWLYWGGQTRMNCLKQCVKETKENAYAHHIQRLMVLGNFALIAGLDPDQVNDWYMVVYADAYQWVELPNVTGMILFADGGLLGSKPYAASGAYINRMSDYCKNCSYQVSKKNGPKACPFNYLYWDFLSRNADKLQGNPRLSMVYNSWRKMDDEKKQAVRDDTERFFKALEKGEA
ncbi:MAG: cryptochrome/photolyase family protein [Pseudobdellovibrionaceae bacterium]